MLYVLQKMYPVCFHAKNLAEADKFCCVYIGTLENNLYIAGLCKSSLTKAEEYRIVVKNDTVVIFA